MNIYECQHIDIDRFPSISNSVWDEVTAARLVDVVTGSEPRLSTIFRLFWNRERAALYIRFDGEDDHAVANMTEHDDSIYEEDVVELFVSETGDLQTYKEFEVSPANVMFDAVIHNNPVDSPIRVNREWHAIDWKTETYSGDGKFISIWEIPFCNFTGGTPSHGAQWRMNGFRIDRGNNGADEFTAWSPTGEVQFHIPNRFGYLRFV